jgi:hypothetical protein
MFYMAKPIDPRAQLVNGMLQRLGLSARWLATRIEKNHVSVSNWLSGEASPRNSSVWADMLETLKAHETQARSKGDIKVRRAGIRIIPVYSGLSAGTMNSHYADVEHLEVMDWGNDRERWGRVIEGYSMFPVLEPGDIVIFEARPWEPNHVVHAFDDGSDTVKVAKKRGGIVELVPINADYPTLPGAQANVKGVAVARIRKGPHGEETTTTYPHGMRYVPD